MIGVQCGGFRTPRFGRGRIGSSPITPTNKNFIVMKYDWSKEKIEQAVKESDSYSEVLKKMGIPT